MDSTNLGQSGVVATRDDGGRRRVAILGGLRQQSAAAKLVHRDATSRKFRPLFLIWGQQPWEPIGVGELSGCDRAGVTIGGTESTVGLGLRDSGGAHPRLRNRALAFQAIIGSQSSP